MTGPFSTVRKQLVQRAGEVVCHESGHKIRGLSYFDGMRARINTEIIIIHNEIACGFGSEVAYQKMGRRALCVEL